MYLVGNLYILIYNVDPYYGAPQRGIPFPFASRTYDARRRRMTTHADDDAR